MEAAKRGSDDGDFGYSGASLPELVEAATRCRQPEVAAAALARLEERTRAAGTDWALGVLARSQALMSEGEDADALYREAIERLERTRIRVELARAHLLYGEWLRRENRRVDARDQLRTAHEMFSRSRSRGVRRACPSRAPSHRRDRAQAHRRDARGYSHPRKRRSPDSPHDGLSNPEIGAQLFISPRTVEYHLHKVFAKLEITSRNQLGRLPAGRLSSA